MRILVTGITGFAGHHLASALLKRDDVELFGTSRRGATDPSVNRVSIRKCDLADEAAADGLIREVRPDQIYHLAGYAHAGQSLQEPKAAWTGNLSATLNLYEAIQRWSGKPR